MVRQFAISRIVVGAAAFVAPKLSARLFAFPLEHDSATARTMGRLFGVRDVALGALVLRFGDDPEVARTLHRVNAMVDLGDASAGAIALARRDGIDRAALLVLGVGSVAAATGFYLAAQEEEGGTTA